MNGLVKSIEELQANGKQWEAFETQGHCVVLAPPGSGKTKLLTTRMAYDLATAIPEPHGAACITLTNAAANELHRRIEILGTSNRSTLFVGTVHSFALRHIIRPFAAMLGRSELLTASIASDQQQGAAYDGAIREVYGYQADLRYVKSTVEINRRRLADDEQWARSGERLREVARLYESKLLAEGLVDFEYLIAAAVQFVEQHAVVGNVLTARYQRLYVDEYQDLPPGLDRLVQALCFNREANAAQLFAVGDPDQAVYGWVGSRPELLEELAGRIGVGSVHLEQNYRSGAEILRVANVLMRKGKPPMQGSRDGGHITATYVPGDFTFQAQRALQAILEFRADGVPLHEIVAICPWGTQCDQVTTLLRTNGIPAFVRGSEYRLTEITMFVEACAAWALHGRETSGYRLAGLLRRWKSALGRSWERSSDVTLTRLLLSTRAASKARASEFLIKLIDAGVTNALRQSGRSDDLLEVERMLKAFDGDNLAGTTIEGLADGARTTNRVEVTTMTSSKGLEFDVVLLLGADEKLIPNFNATSRSEMDEERRKFYVSITRARDHVRIFYSGCVVWRSGRREVTSPSRFLREIGLVG